MNSAAFATRCLLSAACCLLPAVCCLLSAASDRRLVWLAREPFPSVATGTSLNFGMLDDESSLTSHFDMGDSGVIFADDIETDRVEFLKGQSCSVGIASERLRLALAG